MYAKLHVRNLIDHPSAYLTIQQTFHLVYTVLHKSDNEYRRLGAKGSYLTLVRVADRII